MIWFSLISFLLAQTAATGWIVMALVDLHEGGTTADAVRRFIWSLIMQTLAVANLIFVLGHVFEVIK
jgi:hypothetical protein